MIKLLICIYICIIHGTYLNSTHGNISKNTVYMLTNIRLSLSSLCGSNVHLFSAQSQHMATLHDYYSVGGLLVMIICFRLATCSFYVVFLYLLLYRKLIRCSFRYNVDSSFKVH